jgi:hypothetical protein
MPRFDGSGPLGEGPMTGGGFGYCGTRRRPGYGLRGRALYGGFGPSRGPGFGRGRGLSRGFGLSYGDWRPGAVDAKPRLAELQQEANDLRAYLKDLEARIGELEKSSD